MSFPQTLAGLVGFILFIGFISANILNSDANQIPAGSVSKNMTLGGMNNTGDNQAGFFGIASAFGNTVWTVILTVSKLASFQVDGLPAIFSVFFDMVIIALFISIVKVIWSGE